jgi:CheY-like chemotaxis protein
VVKDDAATRDALCKLLVSVGYAVYESANARSIFDRPAGDPLPRSMPLDGLMPEMD